MKRAQATWWMSRYMIEETLAKSPDDVVWKAWDDVQQREVVIKARFDDGAPLFDEYQRLRRLPHPRLPSALDCGIDSSPRGNGRKAWWFTQTWIAGKSLASRLGGFQPETPEPLLQLAHTLLDLVDFLHGAGLHRLDLKPEHLIEAADGWYLIDLDQARAAEPLGELELHGTVPYAAPEVLGGESIDQRSDIYSAGAVLYHAMTGEPRPAQGKTLDAIREHLRATPPPRLPNPWRQAAPELCDFVEAALAPDPADRPRHAGEAIRSIGAAVRFPALETRHPLPETSLLERDELQRALDRFVGKTKEGGFFVVSGPRGSGRSRMLRETLCRWQTQGCPALLVHGRHVGPVSRLWPVVARFLGTLVGAQPHPPADDDALAWARHVLGLAKNIPADRPDCRILIDDADQMDDFDQAVAARLLPYLDSTRLHLVLATTPLEEASRPAPARRTRRGEAGASPAGFLVQLAQGPSARLQPLSETAVRTWLHGVADTRLDPADCPAGRVATLSGGLPARISTLIQACLRHPGGTLDANVFSTASEDVRTLLHAVPRAAREGLFGLACLEIPFEGALAHHLMSEGSHADRIEHKTTHEGVLEGLVSSRILTRTEDGRHYVFADPALRLALLDQYSGDLDTLRAEVAGALERYTIDAKEPVISREIGRLFRAAGLAERALPYLIRAAEQAEKMGRWSEAADRLEECIEALPGPARASVALKRRRTDALLKAGRYDLAADEAQRAAGSLDGAEPDVEAQVHGAAGEALAALGKQQAAIEHLERAIEVARETKTGDRADLARWFLRLAWIHLEIRDLDRAREWLHEADRVVPPGRDSLGLERLHLEAALAIRAREPKPELSARLKAAVDEATRAKRDDLAISLQNCLVEILPKTGDAETVRGSYEELIKRCRSHLDAGREAAAHHNFALWLSRQGDSRGAAREMERATRLYARIEHGVRRIRNQLELASILLEANRTTHAKAVLDEARTHMEKDGMTDEPTRIAWDLLDLRRRRLDGHREGLAESLAQLATRAQEVAIDTLRWEIQAERMAMALDTDQPALAGDLFHEIADDLPADTEDPLVETINRLADDARRRLAGETANQGPTVSERPGGSSRSGGANLDGTATPGTADADGRFENPAQADELVFCLNSLRSLVASAGDGAAMAVSLAELVGNLLEGRGLVLLFDGTQPQVIRGDKDLEDNLDDISTTMLEKVRETRQPLVYPDVLADPELQGVRSLRASKVRSVVCYPILRDNTCIGAIYVDCRTPDALSGRKVMKILSSSADLAAQLLNALRAADSPAIEPKTTFGMLGSSRPMQMLRKRLETLAKSDKPDLVVLFLGETGTGKSMVAKSLHYQGQRKHGPFTQVNCASLSDGLFESRMFGHTKGSFTGATKDQPGFFEMAAGGTLFLDEVAELNLTQQAALLAPLGGSKTFRRIGGTEDKPVDFHLFCATTKDLEKATESGEFRKELYRRIKVNVCRIPPLRERGAGDIDLIAGHLIAKETGRGAGRGAWVDPRTRLTPAALDFLHQYEWPYNVAELEDLFRNEQIRVTLSDEKSRLDLSLIREALDLGQAYRIVPLTRAALPPPGMDYEGLEAWCRHQKAAYIEAVLKQHDDNVSAAAKALKCGRDTIYKYKPRHQ